jgi:hypothetical protein
MKKSQVYKEKQYYIRDPMLSARLIRGRRHAPFAVDDMVHVMLHSRSTTWSMSCSIRAPFAVDDMLHSRSTTWSMSCSIRGRRHGPCHAPFALHSRSIRAPFTVHLRFAGSTIDNSIRGGHRGYFMSRGHDAPPGPFCPFWPIFGIAFLLVLRGFQFRNTVYSQIKVEADV